MLKLSQDIKLLLAGGLILIAAAYVVFYTPFANAIFGVRDAKVPTVQNKFYSKISPKVSATLEAISRKSEARIGYLRNPFNVDFAFEKTEGTGKPTEEVKKITMFELQGVFILGGGKVTALIDDKMLTEGQKLYDWTVSKIYSDRVVLVRGNAKKVLRLKLGVE